MSLGHFWVSIVHLISHYDTPYQYFYTTSVTTTPYIRTTDIYVLQIADNNSISVDYRGVAVNNPPPLKEEI